MTDEELQAILERMYLRGLAPGRYERAVGAEIEASKDIEALLAEVERLRAERRLTIGDEIDLKNLTPAQLEMLRLLVAIPEEK